MTYIRTELAETQHFVDSYSYVLQLLSNAHQFRFIYGRVVSLLTTAIVAVAN
jgi:hypothetical protein